MDWLDTALNLIVKALWVITWPIRFIARLLHSLLKDILTNVYTRSVAIIGGLIVAGFIGWLMSKGGHFSP